MSDKKKLGIEICAIKGLKRKKLFRRFRSEHFETALSVAKRQAQNELLQISECIRQLAPREPLHFFQLSVLVAARANHNLGTGLNLLEKFPDKFDRHGIVGIHKEAVLPLRSQHTGLDAKSFAAIFRKFQYVHIKVSGKFSGNRSRAVRAPISNNENFALVLIASKIIDGCSKGARQPSLFVERGNDNR